MKKVLTAALLVIFSLAIVTSTGCASCTKSGCPSLDEESKYKNKKKFQGKDAGLWSKKKKKKR